MFRVDVMDVGGLNLRIPAGNKTGANNNWLPGGYIKIGILEVVGNKISKSRAIITKNLQ